MYYTIYSKKTGQVIACGNSAVCAKKLGMSMATFYCMVSRVLKGRNKKYEVVKEPF